MITHIFKILVLLIFSSTILALPVVITDTKYYSIYGLNADELRREMSFKSPVRQSGKTYDAYTSWYVNWRFNWNENDGQCYMTDVTSTVDIKFTLPKWSNQNNSNNLLKNKWDRYYNALRSHENGPKKFGVNAAEEVERELIKLSSYSCQLLEKKANALGKKIIDKYTSMEKEYDNKTNHGMNNGAKFP